MLCDPLDRAESLNDTLDCEAMGPYCENRLLETWGQLTNEVEYETIFYAPPPDRQNLRSTASS